MKKIPALIVALIMCLVLVACGDESPTAPAVTTAPPVENGEDVNEDGNGDDIGDDNITFGSTFEYDELQITIGTDVEWITVDNEYSEYYQADVAKIPVAITNIGEQTNSINFMFVTYFGSKATQIDSVAALYMDDSMEWAGDIRTGGTQNSFIYIMYDGDGEYAIELGFFDKTEVILALTKPE
jgi:hypothetical protein